MADDLEGREEPLVSENNLTPEQFDEKLWASDNAWPSDRRYESYRWAFDELETIFGQGKVAIGDCDFGYQIGAGVKMRFSNGVVVRNVIHLAFPPHVEGEDGFDVNKLDRDDALTWIRVEAKLVRTRGSRVARQEWRKRHPEVEEP